MDLTNASAIVTGGELSDKEEVMPSIGQEADELHTPGPRT
jgi:hypothetical protein